MGADLYFGIGLVLAVLFLIINTAYWVEKGLSEYDSIGDWDDEEVLSLLLGGSFGSFLTLMAWPVIFLAVTGAGIGYLLTQRGGEANG